MTVKDSTKSGALLSIVFAFTVSALLKKFVFSDVSWELYVIDLDAACEAVSVLEE